VTDRGRAEDSHPHHVLVDVDQTSPGVPSAGLVGAFMLLFVCLGGVTFLAAAVSLVIVVTRRGRARRERMRQWMAQYGWTMTESPAVDWGNRLPGQNPGGVSRIICGTLGGRPVCVGDYSYTYRALADNTGRRGSARRAYVVVVVRLAEPGPTIAVERRGAFSKLARTLVGEGDAGTADPQFDRTFRVLGCDPMTAQRLLGPALRAAHLAGQVPPWSLQQTDLMTYYPGNIDRPEQIPRCAAPLVRVADLLGR